MSTADMKSRQTGRAAIRQVVLFDGACALCNGTVRWLSKNLRALDVRFLPSQSELGQRVLLQHGLPLEPATIYVFEAGRVLERSDAVFALVVSLRPPYPFLRNLVLLPHWLRDGVYGMVASVRRWIPMAGDRCEFNKGGWTSMKPVGRVEDFPEWLLQDAANHDSLKGDTVG